MSVSRTERLCTPKPTLSVVPRQEGSISKTLLRESSLDIIPMDWRMLSGLRERLGYERVDVGEVSINALLCDDGEVRRDDGADDEDWLLLRMGTFWFASFLCEIGFGALRGLTT